MKRIIVFLIGAFVYSSVCFGQVTMIDVLTADDVTVYNLQTNFTTAETGINSADGALLQAGTIPATALDDNADPTNRWDEAFNDFVFTGLTIPTSASLTSTTTLGTAYVLGTRVLKDATPKVYTASKHTFVDLSNNGTYTYSEVAIQATEPVVATNSIRIARVSSDTTTVSSVRDDRITGINLSNTSLIQDADSDTSVDTEANTDEDIIRFKTADVQRAQINASGLVLSSGADITNFSTDATLAGNSDDAVPTQKAIKTWTEGGNFDARVKGWINLDGTGVIADDDSFNVSGITDEGVGEYTITWDTDFTNADYAVSCMSVSDSTRINALATGSARIHTFSAVPAAEDTDPLCCIACGTQ